jgi:cyanophycinase-like exopeptidase
VTLGVLALLGSGEIAPSMTKVHRQLLKRLDSVRAVSLDTAYGFQANVPQMTEKILEYFSTSLRLDIKPLHFTSYDDSSDVERAAFRQDVRAANYVFAGPGSPSYAVHQWAPLGIEEDFRGTLEAGGVLCFASAAALTLGSLTVPVYEIYKVGTKAHWLPGLDVLSMAGIRGAVIPHYDNAEGGNYDTRFCYLGEERLLALEHELPDDTGILGVDEHTAGIIDLEAKTLSVLGKGGVYWRRHGSTRTFASGSAVDLAEIQTFVPDEAAVHRVPSTEVTDLDALVELAGQGGPASIDALAALARRATTGGTGYIDPTELLSGLLALRVKARGEKNFALADEIRDVIVASGIDVMDTPDGSTWSIK